MKTKAFTLIELLTVIAIIGILAGIMIPTVGSVKKRAHLAVCTSNLRQIHIALTLYANDNKDTWPPGKLEDPPHPWPTNLWMYQIQPYTEQRKVRNSPENHMLAYGGLFHCPGKPNWSLSGPTDSERVSYGMNTFGDQGKGASRSLADEPGITALVTDIPTGNPVLRPGKNDLYDVFYAANFPQLHNGKDNVVFCDGHVEQIKKNGLDRNDSWKKKR